MSDTTKIDRETEVQSSPLSRGQLDAVWAGALALLFCVAFAPVLIFPTYTPRMALLLVVAPVGAVALVRLVRRGERAAWAAVAISVWILIGALFSGEPLLAIRGTLGNEMSGLIMIAVLCLWAIGRTCDGRERQVLSGGLFLGLVASGMVGLLQIVLHIENGDLALWVDRPTGFTPNPVYFGALMAGGAVMAAGVLARRWSPLGVGSLIFFAFMANASGSRVSVIAGLIGSVAVSVKHVGERRLRALPIVYIGSVIVSSWFVGAVTSTTSASGRVFGDSSSAGRWQVWQYGWTAFLERPIAGWGFGRFRASVQQHYSAAFSGSSVADDLSNAWFDAHNIVVAVVLASGLVGLMLMTWFVVAAVRGASGPLAWFAFGAALTWFLQPAGLATLPIVAFALGASASTAPGRLDGQPGPERVPWAERRLGRPEIVALVVGAILGGGLLLGDFRLSRAADHGDAHDIERAAAWFPRDSVVADLVAQAFFIEEEADPSLRPKVLEWSNRAIDAEPDRPLYFNRLAGRLFAFDQPEQARNAIEQALELHPWNKTSWSLMAYYALATDDEAVSTLANSKLCQLGRDEYCE